MEWIVSDQEEMTNQVKILISTIRNTPKGNDPEVVKLLDEYEKEMDLCKKYGILVKIIPLLR